MMEKFYSQFETIDNCDLLGIIFSSFLGTIVTVLSIRSVNNVGIERSKEDLTYE